MVIVFDLDDTLFEELTYVQSGFRAVADYLQGTYGIPAMSSLDWMMQKLAGGRGRIFDDLLMEFHLYNKKTVRKCLSVYHHHFPTIHLSPEADACLKRFAKFPIYIVTDGNKLVQTNKLQALGLFSRANFCYVTHRYGIRNAKPSPYCFLKICEREKVQPQEVVYIGDNPQKDFVGLKPLGFKTIRVYQGQHKDVAKPSEFEADFGIKSLMELDEVLLKRIFDNTGSEIHEADSDSAIYH